MRLYFNELMKIISLYITSKLKKQKQTRLQMLLIYFFYFYFENDYRILGFYFVAGLTGSVHFL